MTRIGKRTQKQRASVLTLSLTVVLALLAVAPTLEAQAAQPQLLREFCHGAGYDDGAPGRCVNPRGLAVSPDTGNLYVADSVNYRIQEFTPWGSFIRAWGWGVVASGPGNKPKNERQELTVDATGGSFSLSYALNGLSFHKTPPISLNASATEVQNAIQGVENEFGGPPTVIEAVVSGPNGGPWTIEYTGATGDIDMVLPQVTNSSLTGGSATATLKTPQQGGNFEVCDAANGDVCRSGQGGSSPGQFGNTQGVSIDSNGNVYVVDGGNARVQKFDSEGHFLLMFGGGVDEGGGVPSNPGDVCTAEYIANGDTCGSGNSGTGNSEFDWRADIYPVLGSFISVGPADQIYVGDEGRIQEFDVNGSFKGQITENLVGENVQALAASPSGDLYVALFDLAPPDGFVCCSKPDVLRLSPSGQLLGSLKASDPRAIATDSEGNVYVANIPPRVNTTDRVELLRFDPSGAQLETPGFIADGMRQSFGIATSSACGIDGADIFIANVEFNDSFIGLYGPPPDPSLCPPPEVPPSIEGQSTLSVDTDGAALRAEINPHFWPDTRYYVQYGTGKCSEGGCGLSQPVPPGSLLSSRIADTSLTTRTVALSGLQPDTTYHYRFVAVSSGGGPVYGVGGTESQEGAETTLHTPPSAVEQNTQCPNQAFRTGASAKLADCRAYELVSPLDKDNTDIAIKGATYVQASVDGNRMAYAAFRAFADPEAAPLFPQFLSSRDPQLGWSTTSVSPPRSAVSLYPLGASLSLLQYKGFSDDLCEGWLIQDTDVAYAPGAPPKVGNLYRRNFCSQPGYELLTTVVPPGFGYEPNSDFGFKPLLQGFSADGSRSVIRANAALTPNAIQKKGLYQLYETDGAGHLRLVSVMPDGKAAPVNSSAGTPQGTVSEYDSVRHAVSADGTRVFWTASNDPNPEGGLGIGDLYLRLNALEAQSQISAGKCTQPSKACTIAIAKAPARFEMADPEGTVAIYSVGEFNEKSNAKLYEFDVATQTSRLISEGVRGVMGASEDAHRVYFASTRVLTGEGTNGEGDKAQAGQPNLYLYEAGEGGGEVSFVVTLSSDDASNITMSTEFPGPLATWTPIRTSRVSPDGLHAAFTSDLPLTGYDNRDVANGRRDAELFVYDSETGGIHCASCDPTGARPVGREIQARNNGAEQLWSAVRMQGWASQYRQPNSLSSDGKRLFFDSFGPLVLGDTNGRSDVYEWEAPGAGDCTEESNSFREANEGCITLISSGESPEDAEFFDATPSGSDVFFATQSSLLSQDYGLTDVYDARVNGGFPEPPETPPACEGEACQGPLSPPNDPTPASSVYEGAGNPKAVAKKKAAKKKARKHKRQKAKKANHKRAKANREAGR